MRRLILIMLIPFLILACDAKDDPAGELRPYHSPNYPVTFQLPEKWAVADDEDSITIASHEELLFASSVDPGARINIIVSPSFFSGSANATEAIETAVRGFRGQDGAEIIQEIQSSTVNNQMAVETVLRGPDTQGNEVILRYLIIENLSENQVAIVAAVHAAENNNLYGPIMSDIVQSIQLGVPVDR